MVYIIREIMVNCCLYFSLEKKKKKRYLDVTIGDLVVYIICRGKGQNSLSTKMQ